MMELIVGTDSTWSLRAWICMTLTNQSFAERVFDLGSDNYRDTLPLHSPTGQVPVLKHGELCIHDSLAIAEYINELSQGALFPDSLADRALARSLCAELHTGFSALRSRCPFTLQAVAPVEFTGDISRELERLTTIFAAAKRPFMFEQPGAVDAFYAVLAYRLRHYGIRLDGAAGQYQQALLDWPLLQQAIQQARHWAN